MSHDQEVRDKVRRILMKRLGFSIRLPERGTDAHEDRLDELYMGIWGNEIAGPRDTFTDKDSTD